MSAQLPSAATILIVDDNSDNLRLLSDMLATAGYEIRIARSGEQALERVQYAQPDLILLDVMMPGLDGFETCCRLKAQEATQAIPVIFTTALAEPADKIQGFNVGAVDYIAKPFFQEEVLARVQIHLRLSLLTRTLADRNQLLDQLVQTLETEAEARASELQHVLGELQTAQVQLLQQEERLQYSTFHDALTRLPNRASLLRRLEAAVRFSNLYPEYQYALLLLDLKRFHRVNESLGHAAGDRLLQAVAERLQVAAGRQHFVARVGSDEFVVLQEGLQQPEEAADLATTLLASLQEPIQVGGQEVLAIASLGIACSREGYTSAADALRDATIALSRSRSSGSSHYTVFNPRVETADPERFAWENELRWATARREFCLYYQPIVKLSTGRLIGFEALARWQHPKRGLVSPQEFIGLAEEMGLIGILGWQVLELAAQQLQEWQRLFPEHPLFVNVNLSVLQLNQPDFAPCLAALLREHGLTGDRLRLELTESCFLATAEKNLALLQAIKDLGIDLCIDDFGVGYSSLSRLLDFPVNCLKIDRAFVSRLTEQSGQAIVQSILTLASHLEIDAIAEGIEVPDQAQALQRLNCHFGQGYWIAPPLTAAAATDFCHLGGKRELNPPALGL